MMLKPQKLVKVFRRNKSTGSSEKYQYLQRSMLPTDVFQVSLPRLPIPLLEKSCERFLTALRPIVSNEIYLRSEKTVNQFRSHVGYLLQQKLKDHDAANKQTSYISQPWSEMYLRDRSPLPLNYNPALVWKNDERKEYNNQLIRASNFVISSLRFYKSLKENVLEPEVFHMNAKKSDTDQFRRTIKYTPSFVRTYVAYAFKAFPLDMSQYKGLFGATRIPEDDMDRILREENPKHLLVMRKGQFFVVDVLDENGDIPEPEEIMGKLKAILDFDIKPADFPLGVMTAGDRNSWAEVRSQLMKYGNESQLKTIDSALFCLCLDDEFDWNDTNPIPMIRNYLAGNAENRWFDKSFSLIIERDGTTAINFEHSWGDGVAVLRYFNEIFKDTLDSPFVHPTTSPKEGRDSIRLLEFNFPDSVKNSIMKAQTTHKKTLGTLDIDFVRNYQLSKNVCKSLKVSPDSVMQLAFQLAYRQAFGKFVGTYESCSTSAFKHGRTETMRPCTMATKKFCDAVLLSSAKKPSVGELGKMLQDCSVLHGTLTKEAAMGQGFDRHLFGLKYMAEINEIDIPDLYRDEGYQIMNYNVISTSTLGSSALLAGGFGAVVPDGLGVAYSIFNDECGAVATSYKGQRDAKLFTENLEDAFQQIYRILSQVR